MPAFRSQIFSIEVINGEGITTVPISALQSRLQMVAIQVPNHDNTITYSIDFTDSDGFGITGRDGLGGDTTFTEDTICQGNIVLTISSASSDGLYSVKLWFLENF